MALLLRPALLLRSRTLWQRACSASSRRAALRQPAVGAAALSTATAPAAAEQQAAAAVGVKSQPRGGRLRDEGWPGLGAWRRAALDERTTWGEHEAAPAPGGQPAQAPVLGSSLAECARQVLLTADPREKALITHEAWRAYKAGALPVGVAEPPGSPARPAKPELVHPKKIPTMKLSPLPLNVYMLHNLAHIELNAIDLAWDTVARFSSLGLPQDFYADFARVADDEARHLLWCLQRMGELGYEYGCMPAHNLLWEGAEMSSDDLFARLAIVPMSQEARGLDAGKRLAEKLVGWGDNRTAAIVHQIALEERNHVAVGVAWFQAICDSLGVDAGPAFRSLLLELCPDLLKGPFNIEERGIAGLPRGWYDADHWPQPERAVMEALKAQQRGERQGRKAGEAGNDGSAASSGSAVAAMEAAAAKAQHAERVRILPLAEHGGEQLQQLRQRLAAMLEIELRVS